jgi:hypothetical protein
LIKKVLAAITSKAIELRWRRGLISLCLICQILKYWLYQACFVLDAHWNVVQIKSGGVWLAKTLIPWLELSNQTMNMLDLLCHPEGFTKLMLNLREAAPLLLGIIKKDVASQPTLEPKLRAFEAILQSKLGKNFLDRRAATSPPPLLTTRFSTSFGDLSFFSMFTTFGTPQDITLASLKVEHVFAADDVTRSVVLSQTGFIHKT